ncbi:MAG: hypothetical protein WAV18_30385 [Roseiarcus sp.]
MEAKDWLPIFFERSNAEATLWNIEIVVVLGLVAFVGGAGARLEGRLIKVAIIIAFLVMVAFNILAIVQVTEQRAILADLIHQISSPSSIMDEFRTKSGVVSPLDVPSVWLVVGSHIVVDFVVCLFVWLYPKFAARPAE